MIYVNGKETENCKNLSILLETVLNDGDKIEVVSFVGGG